MSPTLGKRRESDDVSAPPVDRCHVIHRPRTRPPGRELTAQVRVKDVPVTDRPRERLARLGAEALSDRELLAILLHTSGVAGYGVLDLADRLIVEAGGLCALGRASVAELCRPAGIGPAKATIVVAALALSRRIDRQPVGDRLHSSTAIAAAARPWLQARSRERAIVLTGDHRLRLLGIDVVSEGAADSAPLPIREVLAAVLRRDGAAFAVAHNHPGGDPAPSGADLAATARLRSAAAEVGLRFLDHVILAGTRWRSVTSAR